MLNQVGHLYIREIKWGPGPSDVTGTMLDFSFSKTTVREDTKEGVSAVPKWDFPREEAVLVFNSLFTSTRANQLYLNRGAEKPPAVNMVKGKRLV